MLRFIGKSADGRIDIGGTQPSETVPVSSGNEFGKRRTGGNGSCTPPDFKTGLRHTAVFHQRRQPKNIAANGIRHFNGDCRHRQFANIARIPEVVNQLRRHGLSI